MMFAPASRARASSRALDAIAASAAGRARGPARYSFCKSISTRQESESRGRLKSAPASSSRVLGVVMMGFPGGLISGRDLSEEGGGLHQRVQLMHIIPWRK